MTFENYRLLNTRMEKDYVLQVADTIKDQLVAVTPIGVIRSWHVEKFMAVEYKGMAALRFHVSGEAFCGNVIVAHKGQDCYEVHLQNYSGTKHIKDEVHFMELGETIDRAVRHYSGKSLAKSRKHRHLSWSGKINN